MECSNCKVELGIYEYNKAESGIACNSCFGRLEKSESFCEEPVEPRDGIAKSNHIYAPQSSRTTLEQLQNSFPEFSMNETELGKERCEERSYSFVTVAAYYTELNAVQACEYLLQNGIPAEVTDQHFNTVVGVGLANGGIKVTVSLPDKLRAEQLLELHNNEMNSDNRAYTFLIPAYMVYFELICTFIGLNFIMNLIYQFEKTIMVRIIIAVTAALITGFRGSKFSRFQCSDYNCSYGNSKHAEVCAGCGKEIKALLNHRDEIMAKEEELGLS